VSHSRTTSPSSRKECAYEELFRSSRSSSVGLDCFLGPDRAGDMAGRMVALTAKPIGGISSAPASWARLERRNDPDHLRKCEGVSGTSFVAAS